MICLKENRTFGTIGESRLNTDCYFSYLYREVSMKILLVSDKENDYIWDHFEPARFKDIELIISCGDLQPSYLSFLVTMVNVPLFTFMATMIQSTPSSPEMRFNRGSRL